MRFTLHSKRTKREYGHGLCSIQKVAGQLNHGASQERACDERWPDATENRKHQDCSQYQRRETEYGFHLVIFRKKCGPKTSRRCALRA